MLLQERTGERPRAWTPFAAQAAITPLAVAVGSRRRYIWLPREERWRIAYAWRQFQWYPKFLFRVVEEMGYSADLNQMVEICVWLSHVDKLDKTAQGRLVQKELRAFFVNLGIHKRAGQWTLCEFPRSNILPNPTVSHSSDLS